MSKKDAGVVAALRWSDGVKEMDISDLNARVVVCFLPRLMKVSNNQMNLFGLLNGY